MGRKKTTGCPALSEKQWQRQVIEYARLRGWRLYHHRPALNQSGRWSTALTGDAGLPDLILVRGGRLVFAELKTDSGRVSQEQEQWLAALTACSCEVYLWRPRDWQEVVEVLK